MKWTIRLSTLLIAATLSWVALIRTDGFSLNLIQGSLHVSANLPIASSVLALLKQPFVYLGKGRQSFVFESEDQKTVLKFFNQKYFQLPWYTHLPLPKEWQRKEKEKRALRKDFYLHSYTIAFEKLKEETGILYIHLAPTPAELPSIQAKDKASAIYTLELDRLAFVVQKKGTPFYSALDSSYAKEGMAGLKRDIDLWIQTISRRIDQKIADADHDVEHNWAILDGRPFHLDPGRLYYDDTLSEPGRLKQEWWAATHSFRKWLKKRYPDAVAHLDAMIHAKL
ncbi:MAG: hypothetical protein V4487_00460 [Chlamydiota bacterium]